MKALDGGRLLLAVGRRGLFIASSLGVEGLEGLVV